MLDFPSHRQERAQRDAAIRRLRMALNCDRLVTLFERITLLAITRPNELIAIEATVAKILRGEHRRPSAAKALLPRTLKSEAS